MGKASSSKKVARAARAGGNLRTARDRKWGYPLAIGAIVVVGALLIVFVRADQSSQAAEPPRLGQDHWHASYGVFLCDTFAPPLSDTQGDKYGIHTHDDGLIHIHPTTGQAAGANATFGRFAEELGVELTDDSFTMPSGGQTYTDGDDCGGEPGVVRLLKWSGGDFEGDPEIVDSDFGSVRFTDDGEAFTLFFGPESALDDPQALLPPSLSGLQNVSDLEPGQTGPDVSIPEDLLAPATTAPATTAPADGSSTTVAADGSSATTAPATTAPPTTAG